MCNLEPLLVDHALLDKISICEDAVCYSQKQSSIIFSVLWVTSMFHIEHETSEKLAAAA